MQSELFPTLEGKTQAVGQLKLPVFPGRFLRLRVAYEDLIFSGLTLVLVLLAGFCLGMERGKRLGRSEMGTGQLTRVVPVRRQEAPSLPAMTIGRTPAAAAPRSAVVSSSTAGFDGFYAIQLASFLGPRPAQLEAERLARQGFKAEVIPQGKFFEVRVSGYRSREEASRHLAVLKKTYHDAFIKQVSSRRVLARAPA